MPITPSEAASKSTSAIATLVKAHAKVFDQHLAEDYVAGGNVVVTGTSCPSVPPHVREKVAAKLRSLYGSAGWKLERKEAGGSDPRGLDATPMRWIFRADPEAGLKKLRYEEDMRMQAWADARAAKGGGYGSLDQGTLDSQGR